MIEAKWNKKSRYFRGKWRLLFDFSDMLCRSEHTTLARDAERKNPAVLPPGFVRYSCQSCASNLAVVTTPHHQK
jgi:hypothetical protein